jgi:hypothetical protein
LVPTVDLLIEDVHSELSRISPFQLGRKALADNLSDMAAMGAIPRWVLKGFGPGMALRGHPHRKDRTLGSRGRRAGWKRDRMKKGLLTRRS